MGVASLVLGIIGLIISLVPLLGQYALPLTVLALVLGGFGRRKAAGKGIATAGLVLGIVGSSLGGYWVYATHRVASELQHVMDEPATAK